MKMKKTSCQFFRCYCSWFRNSIPNHREWMVVKPVKKNNGRSTTNLNWWTPDFWTINCIILGWPPLPTNITTGATGIPPPRRDAAAKVVTVPDKWSTRDAGMQHLPLECCLGGQPKSNPCNFHLFLFFSFETKNVQGKTNGRSPFQSWIPFFSQFPRGCFLLQKGCYSTGLPPDQICKCQRRSGTICPWMFPTWICPKSSKVGKPLLLRTSKDRFEKHLSMQPGEFVCIILIGLWSRIFSSKLRAHKTFGHLGKSDSQHPRMELSPHIFFRLSFFGNPFSIGSMYSIFTY